MIEKWVIPVNRQQCKTSYLYLYLHLHLHLHLHSDTNHSHIQLYAPLSLHSVVIDTLPPQGYFSTRSCQCVRMQQCAQCSKTASSSAHRALAGLNNYWEWIPSWIENTASTSSSSSRSKAVKHHTRAYTHSPANDASPGLGAAGFGSFHHFTDEVDRNIKNQRDSQGSPDRSSSSRINRNGSHRSVRYRTSQHEPRDNRRAFSTSANPQEQLQKHDTSDNITPHKSTKEEISVTQAKFRTDDTSSSNASSWEDQSSAPSRIEPTKNSSKETSKGSGTGLKHLTEEVVHSTEEDGGNGSSNKKSDTIHKLLAYPTLYDPIRKPRNRLVLCHGLYGFDTWGLDLLPTLR